MAPSMFSLSSFARRRFKDSLRGLFFIITSLAFVTSLFILFYISSTSKLVVNHPNHIHLHIKPIASSSKLAPPLPANHIIQIPLEKTIKTRLDDFPESVQLHEIDPQSQWSRGVQMASNETSQIDETPAITAITEVPESTQWSREVQMGSNGKHENKREVFHDTEIFLEDYKEMNSSLKIYIYPHPRNHPFANVLLPTNSEPGGNYASESYFKKALARSHFITHDPSEAHLFYLPFSIASLRHDKRVGVGGIQNFVRDYIFDISRRYPYWNRTGGADHFYAACHSVGRTAMEKAVEVKVNAIQVVCSSSYFVPGYVAHKDASMPQIWPRHEKPPSQPPSKRKKLAFYAGAMNSRVREHLVQVWRNDSEISVHQTRVKTPYADSLLGSKFCIHAKGYEVNTARVGDALYYGCVPVILADHYDLPFADILNWRSFSVVLSTLDIPLLKKILKEMEETGEYLSLQKNVLRVQNHFQWHHVPVDYDAFYMVMYELWLRRSSIRVPLSSNV